ncbi:virginiamycin B lyase family protein, partial [Streptomyces hainanensis]
MPTLTTVSEPDAGPYGITFGPDGALWFTLVHAGEIGRLAPDGRVDRFPVDPAGGPTAITTGPDGALWFTLHRANAIGRITVRGETTTYPVP